MAECEKCGISSADDAVLARAAASCQVEGCPEKSAPPSAPVAAPEPVTDEEPSTTTEQTRPIATGGSFTPPAATDSRS
jgi:hypothetical protein